MGGCCVRETIKTVKLNETEKIRIKRKSLPDEKTTFKKSSSIRKRGSIYQNNNENIFDVYVFSTKIGSGYFGTVKLAHPIADPNKIYAVKSIDKSKLNPKKIQNLSREIEVLASLDHPNIVKYYETYNDEQYFHIVNEHLSGGELFDKLSKQKTLNEKEASTIIYKIVSAISHCHSNGIVHRDLKPENILFENQSIEADLKIIDFGLSRKFSEDELHSIVGSPYYVAPEVLEGNYDYQCDIWGIGVIMYVLLSGKPPFYHENKPILFKKIKNDPIPFDSKIWKDISFEAIELIKTLLNKNPKKRPNAKKILEFSWFPMNMKKDFTPRQIDPDIIKLIHNFRQPKQLVKTILKIIVKEVKTSEIENFKKTFMLMDKNKTGRIDGTLIHTSFSRRNSLNSPEIFPEFSNNFQNEDNVENGAPSKYQTTHIDYSSFIATSLRKKNLLNKEILMETFKHLDVENLGYFNLTNFDKAIRRTGKKKKKEDIEEMFRECGFEKDAKIYFDEFCLFIEKYL